LRPRSPTAHACRSSAWSRSRSGRAPGDPLTATGLNTFAGGALDRAGPRRADAAWLAERRADPAARAVVAGADGVLIDGERPALVALGELGDRELVLLGIDDDGAAIFAADGGDDAPPPGRRLVGLREAATLLSQADGGLVAQAAALLSWHRAHRHCANCGAATTIGQAGYVRSCPRCATEHHPRTDPVVIMLVTDGERAVLGRQAAWPQGRYSALAGFVEPGESLEEAVAREVAEETGIAITDVRYRSSQPWPFPTTLMLGFRASWTAGEPHPRDGELQDARWVSRDELRDGRVLKPPTFAIARRLIDEWLAEP
jgi:NAD+ diphosphatase